MPTSNDGIMIILSSPSGAGKTTLVNLLAKKNNYEISISHTTRKPRPKEIIGKDYHFVSDHEFKRLINNEEFLEYAKVFNNYYGSSKELVFKELNSGNNVIFDIDWQGTKKIKNKNLKYNLLTIFILPPSKEELKKRLIKRERKNLSTVGKRMKEFKKDLLKWKDYDYVVINDNLEDCYNKIISVIKNKNKKFDKKFISNHVKNLLV